MIMHDTKMFLFTHRYGSEVGFGFPVSFFFGNPTHWTEVDRRRRKGGGGVTGQEVWPDESTVASGSVGCSLRAAGGGWRGHPHHIHPIQHGVVLKGTQQENIISRHRFIPSAALDWIESCLRTFLGAVK